MAEVRGEPPGAVDLPGLAGQVPQSHRIVPLAPRSLQRTGGGTPALDPATGLILPHIHLAAGIRGEGAAGRTSHLLNACGQFLSGLLVIEVTGPTMVRLCNPSLYDVPLLTFGPTA
ncbi:hypothetical protein [Streptomyces sp. CB03911]|uniref:hypothetical protein n=1 Tax=Streptomyces sp. CB03911 TaxID=1804758 RepID=UPI0018FE2337|nr:hypothetical protein [Streptomyces sp. CB03911]